MREFFHGWRRKAGCIALLMASVLMACWIRSLRFTDSIAFPIQTRQYIVSTYQGVVFWAGLEAGFVEWSCEFSKPPDEPLFAVRDDQLLPTFESTDGMEVWTVPYWSVTIPLTFLSAYLLLWKPRKRSGTEHA